MLRLKVPFLTRDNQIDADFRAIQQWGASVDDSIDNLTEITDDLIPTQGYVVDDVIALESSLKASGTGEAPALANFLTDFALYNYTANTTRHLQSAVQLPHSYVNGTDLSWHVHFTNPTAIASGSTVKFAAEISTASPTGTFPATTIYTSTFTATSNVPANSHRMTASVTIPGSTLTGSSFVLARIYRDTTDTHNGNIYLLGSDYHIQKNRIGSLTENPTT